MENKRFENSEQIKDEIKNVTRKMVEIEKNINEGIEVYNALATVRNLLLIARDIMEAQENDNLDKLKPSAEIEKQVQEVINKMKLH